MKTNILTRLKIGIFYFFLAAVVNGQQINISRIDQMPDFPSPYVMRDWESAAKGYDSLVFNQSLSGQYLPLLFFRNNTVNYPGDISFGLHTVVGTTSPTSGEAINVIPAVVGASLVGIDKSSQNGYNWVRMCREFFNKRPEQNVYKNHPVDDTYDDWWYETMPNVFFYQLYDLYPQTDDFDFQLTSVADQWLKAVEKMDGSSTPWNVPYMNYTGWDLSKMAPHTGSVTEPESAGAIAWLLYNAYKETGEKRFRIGAEWAMEFLNAFPTNPSYELQLSFGTYIAAKMNAELGTEYDVEKMVNWCFDVGPLRDWGVTLGKWGGLDISGLVGEINGSNDYAFLMNTFEQASALVPLVRYDDRFASAVGKWMLNAANAARLFYANYLPDSNQDSEEWSHQYDPNSYIGHEGLHQHAIFGSSLTPYATGDAIEGNWGATNLALYGSSHIGIFGSIIDTTNIEGILKLDLLKTDFFNDEAYPTYLLYNPYDESKIVQVDVGNNSIDVYETTRNSFILNNVSGNTGISVPPKSAYVIVFTPTSRTIKYNLNNLLINGVIVDYSSGQSVANYPPRIKSLAAIENIVLKGDSINIYCNSVDKDADVLNFTWSASNGELIGSGVNVIWVAPNQNGIYNIQVEVDDGSGEKSTEEMQIEVIEEFNTAPKINKLNALPRKIDLDAQTEITCSAVDSENDPITYLWNSDHGIIQGSGESITWTAPGKAGNYSIVCTVSDSKGESSADSIIISVRDLSITQSGNLICFLPFSGNAEDASGNGNVISVSGAVLNLDRFGISDNAYKFDGANDNIRVTNSALLNFGNSITINFWIKINKLYEREQYPISHGNWEKRWKISVSNDRIRWTIKTGSGIVDLDSETMVETNRWYNVTALYSGSDMELYINGNLDAFKYWSGSINASNVDLTIGQSVPGDNNYNFDGILDEIRIYDYALPLSEIEQFYDLPTSTDDKNNSSIPEEIYLYQNYPNPFNPTTIISFTINEAMSQQKVSLKVYDVLGNEISTLINNYMNSGKHKISFDASNISSGVYFYQLRVGNIIRSEKMVVIK